MTRDIPIAAEVASFPAATQEDWLARVKIVLKGADFESSLTSQTLDGIRIEPLYERKKHAEALAMRGAKPWRICARVDHPDASIAAELALADLENGADSLSIVFADSLAARGYGLKPANEVELDAALGGVDLQLIEVRLEPSCASDARLFADLCERRRLGPDQLNLDFGLDPIGHFARTGGAIPNGFASVAIHTALYLKEHGYHGPFLRADGRVYHDAGASPAQELGAMLAAGVAYLRTLEAAGVALNQARRMISFLCVTDADQFQSIAKLRALRQLWTRVEMACGLEPEPIRLTVETSWRMLGVADPHTNLLRNTIACFSAAIGGADTITVLPFSSASGLPDTFARRLARNTQSILSEEANLWRVADPVAGAGGFEALTDALSLKAWDEFQQIEREGGILKSLAAQHLQARIASVKARQEQRLATGQISMIGVNSFLNTRPSETAALDVTRREFAKASADPGALLAHRISEAFELQARP